MRFRAISISLHIIRKHILENYRCISIIIEFEVFIWKHQDLKYLLISYKTIFIYKYISCLCWEAETEMKLKVKKAYWVVTSVKGKRRKQDWAGELSYHKVDLPMTQPSQWGVPDQRLPTGRVLHWVEMASLLIHHLAASLTGVTSRRVWPWLKSKGDLKELTCGGCQLTAILAVGQQVLSWKGIWATQHRHVWHKLASVLQTKQSMCCFLIFFKNDKDVKQY